VAGLEKANAGATAKTKYRDLSTAAASAPPSVEMTFVMGVKKESEQKLWRVQALRMN